MKRGRLPLTALRSFEAAGRLGSFTLAADELLVSQAAISRQVRELEALVGRPLFTRHHRHVRLSPDGATLLATLVRSFSDIDSCLETIRSRPAERLLTVNAEPSFAACWLVPHLAEFRARHPGIDVAVESEARLIELRSDGAELAIRHSLTESRWPRTQARHLFDAAVVPLLSPSLQADTELARPQELLTQVLLHEEDRDVWTRWFAAVEIPSTGGTARGPIFPDGGLLLQAALRGHGIALIDAVLAREDIEAGRLVQPFGPALANGAYWLVARDFNQLSAAAQTFSAWIQSRFTGMID